MIIIKTSKGDIHLELDSENTPQTVENFLSYVRKGFYNDTIFHRVIDNFMIQGGGFDQNMTSKSTDSPIQNEAKMSKPNKRGTIAMARTSDPHSATAQFFINLVNNSFLDHTAENVHGFGYCTFGEVVQGMDVVDAIAKIKTGNSNGHSDVPVEKIVIQEIVEA